MLNPSKVAQYMYFQEKLEEYNSISYSGMLPPKNKVDDIINGINLKFSYRYQILFLIKKYLQNLSNIVFYSDDVFPIPHFQIKKEI